MRYSTEPKYRNYVEGYDFSSFSNKPVDKYGKKVMNIATKTARNAAKTASNGVVTRVATAEGTAEASGDLIVNKIDVKLLL